MDDRCDDFLRIYWDTLGAKSVSSGYSGLLSQYMRQVRNIAAHWTCPWASPPHVVEFIASYLRERGATNVLDPSARQGLLLASLARTVPFPRGTGVVPDPNSRALAASHKTDAQLEWVVGDPLNILPQLVGSFDFVASELPVDTRQEQHEFAFPAGPRRIRTGHGDLIALTSLAHLAPTGVAIFVVPRGFLHMAGSAAQHLDQLGFQVSAFIELPAGTFAPWTSMPSGLAIIGRKEHEELFVGAISGAPERNRLLLENLLLRRPGPEPALGALVTAADFRSVEALAARTRIDRLAHGYGVAPVTVESILIELNLTKSSDPPGFEERPNSVYLPKIGLSPALPLLSNLRLKPHNYAQLVLDPSKADARFAAAFFNTELGKLIRESSVTGATIPKLTRAGITSMPVYLPPLEDQLRVLAADTKATNLLSEAQGLREVLWAHPRKVNEVVAALERLSREERLTDWIDTLPFPLASILWTYHASGENAERRYQMLLLFFEAFAEFWATLLLSGFVLDEELFGVERQGIRAALEKARTSLAASTFGTWVKIVERLAKRARALLNGSEEDKARCQAVFRTRNGPFLDALVSSTLVGILQETNARRNTWKGHVGVVGEAAAQERRIVLEGYLAGLREALGSAWDGALLLMPRTSRFQDGIFRYEVSRLVGAKTPFETVKVEVAEPLEDGALYVLSVGDSRALKLLPLVKIMPAPRSALNACYFYSRQFRGEIHFISYHFEQEAEVANHFEDTAAALREILRDDGQC